MRTADGELVVAKVEERVLAALAVARVHQLILRVQRDVAVDVAEVADHQLHGLVAERAAGVEAADVLLRGRHLAGDLLGQRLRLLLAHGELHKVLHRLALKQGDRLVRGILQRNGGDQAFGLDLRAVAADEADDHRLAGVLGDVEDLGGDLLGRGLGDERDDLGVRVVDQRVEPQLHHQAADLLLEVAAAGADDLRHAAAQLRNDGADLLRARAGRADHADLALGHDVGKRQRHVVDDRGATVGAHDQQLLFICALFERLLLFDRHVVGEEHDVDVVIEAALRHVGRELAGDGDDRHVQIRVDLDRAFERGRIVRGLFGLRLLVQQFLYLLLRRLKHLVAVALHRHEKVVRGDVGVELRGCQTDVVGDLDVQIGAHAHERFLHAVELFQVFGDEHEGNGIKISVFPDFQFDHCFSLHRDE